MYTGSVCGTCSVPTSAARPSRVSAMQNQASDDAKLQGRGGGGGRKRDGRARARAGGRGICTRAPNVSGAYEVNAPPHARAVDGGDHGHARALGGGDAVLVGGDEGQGGEGVAGGVAARL